MDEHAARIADAIRQAYENTPPEHHGEIDNIRQVVGGALADLGLAEYEPFSNRARAVF
jgi:hypothetical protein